MTFRAAALLFALLFLLPAGCSRQPASAPEVSVPPSPVPAEPAPPPAPVPVTIKEIAVPEGERLGEEWTMVPGGVFHVQVDAPGAATVTLRAARYPSSPEVPVWQPSSREGDRFTFAVDTATACCHLALIVDARGQDGSRAQGQRLVFTPRPTLSDFTTFAIGSVTGWAPENDREVRELFTEGKVLLLNTPAKLVAFAGQMKRLLGVALPAADMKGRTVVAVLGAPADGPRRFEVLEVGKGPLQAGGGVIARHRLPWP